MTHPDIAARERTRWFRCNAHLWVRPDAARFLAPGADLHATYPAFATKYSPNQPRLPAGETGGGQWTSGGSSDGRGDAETLSDADPDSIIAGDQYANVIRVCIASGISRFKDEWGNRSVTITYDRAGGRSFSKSFLGSGFPGILRDPFR